LKYLYLYSNQIGDISCLSGITNHETIRLDDNPLNTAAYCKYLPVIISNNPGLSDLRYDPNPNPLTDDCSTNLNDLAMFTSHWLSAGCNEGNNWCQGADLNHIDDVDLRDWTEFAGYWLK